MDNNDSIKNKITDYFFAINEQLDAAHAICDAALILVELEKSLSHQGTQILTEMDYAHRLKIKVETLPTMLKHARTLVDMSRNETDRMREATVDAIDIYSLREDSYTKH